MPSLGVRALAAAVGALLVLLAFPPTDLWWAAPLGVAAVTLAVQGASPRASAGVGFLAGLFFFVPLLQWTGVEVGPVPWLFLALAQALFFAPLGWSLALVQQLRWWPLWASGCWVLMEALRSRLPFGGFTWGRLAFSQADSPAVGIAAWGGAPAVTGAVALSGSLLAWAVVASRRASAAPAPRILIGVAAACGVLAVGLVAMPATAPAAGVAPVGVVQGNVPRLGLDFNAQRRAVLGNHVQATEELAAAVAGGALPSPQFVLWPENSSDIDPYRDPVAARLIDQAADAVGVPILVGAVVESEDRSTLENTSIVWDPVTGPGQTYIKRHPVPFGEYIPLRSLARLFSSDVDRVARDFVSGDEVGLLDVAGTPVGVVICFEVAYDDLPREAVAAGAQLLVVQTNNATFGFTPQTEQQLAMARLRAVEHHRTVISVATSGVSAVVAPDGVVEQRFEVFTRGTTVTDVGLRTHLTLATRVGSFPEWLWAGIGALAVGVVLTSARRRASPGQENRPPVQESVST